MSDTPFEVRQDLPSAPQHGTPGLGQSGGRRGGSKYDPFVDAILAAAGRAPTGDPLHGPTGPVDPDALVNPAWVRYPADFSERAAAYSVAGNISQQVFKRRAAQFAAPHSGLQLSTSVQAATTTTAEGEAVVAYHAWLRVNPASTTGTRLSVAPADLDHPHVSPYPQDSPLHRPL